MKKTIQKAGKPICWLPMNGHWWAKFVKQPSSMTLVEESLKALLASSILCSVWSFPLLAWKACNSCLRRADSWVVGQLSLEKKVSASSVNCYG